MHNFRELNVWKDAMKIAKTIYSLTRNFPSEERFGLTSQINRSAVSVASNIAEGCGRNTNGEFKRFLAIALGSCYELETQVLLAESFEFINQEQTKEIINEISKNQKMIARLKDSLA